MVTTTRNASEVFFRTIDEEPFLEVGEQDVAKINRQVNSSVKWMGGDAETGPWVYWVKQPAGNRVRPHKHPAKRVEYILDGEIEFYRGDDALAWWRSDEHIPGERFGPGTVSYVPADTVYAYYIVTETTLLHVFFENPMHGTVHLD